MRPYSKLFFLSALLTLSPYVLAQNYSGTVGDLNTIFDPPMNINGTLCDTHVNTGNEHAYKACSDGVSAARWMAEKYAKNTGKYLGCLDGFYQGIYDGYNSGVNPTVEMIRMAEAYVKEARFDSAAERGLEKARAEGQTESADQIIARYRSVINLRDRQGRAVLPSKEYDYPKVIFNGFEDGYEYDILKKMGSEFESVYASGWVNKSSKFEDRLAARKALALQKEYSSSLCNQNDTIFGRRQMPVLTIWDYFRANRQYNFQNYGWRNPDWAWEIFDRDERTLEQYQTFTRLKSLEKTVTETIAIKQSRYKTDASGNPIRKLDSAGQPQMDSQGKPVFEMEEIITGYRNETKRVKLSDAEVKELAGIYINGFKQAYDRFYARQYASINYNQEGLEKYKVAKIIGKVMGEEVANHIARREAYNNQYKLQSAKKYAEEVKNLYKSSFDRLIGIFENNAVIELNEATVIGDVQDAIFRPGEALRVGFAATNLGEKVTASQISFFSGQDVQARRNGFVFSAPALSRQEYVSDILGTVSDQLEARSQITVGMVVQNPGDLQEVARSLVVRKERNITLNDYVEIDQANASLNYLQGTMQVVADIMNPAQNIESPISVVEAELEGLALVQKNVEPIGPKSVRKVVLNVEKLDPLILIKDGSFTGTIKVRLGQKIAHRQNIKVSIGEKSDVALVKYLDALATKRSRNFGNESATDRMARINKLVEKEVMKDIERNILWKKETDITIIGTIQEIYKDSKRAGRIDDEAQNAFNDLGRVLAELVNDRNFRAGGGVRLSASGNKKVYLKQIAKFAKISSNLKDWDR